MTTRVANFKTIAYSAVIGGMMSAGAFGLAGPAQATWGHWGFGPTQPSGPSTSSIVTSVPIPKTPPVGQFTRTPTGTTIQIVNGGSTQSLPCICGGPTTGNIFNLFGH
jgi:hypothetical protein